MYRVVMIGLAVVITLATVVHFVYDRKVKKLRLQAGTDEWNSRNETVAGLSLLVAIVATIVFFVSSGASQLTE